MHDPMALICTVRYPWGHRSKGTVTCYWDDFILGWHVDSEKDGSDDSCGWFIRARHLDQKLLKQVERTFEIEWESNGYGWFNKDGSPRIGLNNLTLDMFRRACMKYYNNSWRKTNKFLKKHLLDIITLADGTFDSLNDLLNNKYEYERSRRIGDFAATILSCIARWDRPWYKHPKFHFWHYQLTIRPLQNFKRWAFGRCAKCKKGFPWGADVWSGGWNSKGPQWFKSEVGIHHSNCNDPSSKSIPQQEKYNG